MGEETALVYTQKELEDAFSKAIADRDASSVSQLSEDQCWQAVLEYLETVSHGEPERGSGELL